MTHSLDVTHDDHVKGQGTDGVTLLEYGDYECGYCGLAYPIVKQIQSEFGDRLRFVFRHFPLTEIHPLAERAAEAAEFAGAHGKFCEMHDHLYMNQSNLGLPLYLEIVASFGLAGQDLRTSLDEARYASKVRQDFMKGVRSGVNGTPAFYINGQRHDGSYDYAELRGAIETSLIHS